MSCASLISRFRGILFPFRSIMLLLVLPISFSSTFANDPNDDWSTILKLYVTDNGVVNYRGILADQEKLNSYLDYLSSNPISESDSEPAQIAYWINVYNAFTIKLIIDHYPLESIKDVRGAIQIPFVNSPWDVKFFKIGQEEMTLNDVEHKILRKKFNEPRIHFAIVCASISCPPLRNEPYIENRLNEQLDEQARIFINDPSKNKIMPNKIEISKIFSWFKGDFTRSSSLIEYLNQYSTVKIDSKADVSYMKYNWGLNGPTGVKVN